MKIVIDIPEEEYAKVKDGRASVSMMRDAIRNGTLLPKGHGRLIDAEDLLRYIDSMPSELNVCAYRMIRRIKLTDYIQDTKQTIIEADKEGAEEKRFERILESASAQVPLRGKREENRPTWQQDREGGAE